MKQSHWFHVRTATICAVVVGMTLTLASPIGAAGGLQFGFSFGHHGLNSRPHDRRHHEYRRYPRNRYGQYDSYREYGLYEFYRPYRRHHQGHRRTYAGPRWHFGYKHH